jgi:hypothetical protein
MLKRVGRWQGLLGLRLVVREVVYFWGSARFQGY